MNYDDAHEGGTGHPGAPCWATTLAVASHHGLDENRTLAGFMAGFEVMARLGGGYVHGVGRTTARRGFHPTAVFGVAGAAAASSALLGLSEEKVANALGVA